MKRHTITLGASTTAGGKVISASSNGGINDVPIALENDSIFCPACKSQGKILCIGPRIPETWNGKQVALEKDLCLCGCLPSPRLIANQSLRCQIVEESDSATTQSTLEAAQTFSSTSAATLSADGYDLDFVIIDEKTGTPISDYPYSIELATGQTLKGRTNHAGKTAKVAASYAEHAIFRAYALDVTPINPTWDR
ncbi:PAAR domain-containing protein [Duganella vulcania]|uniref:PAAR domain-containing protein n=1 Tax=Duganella vulcania TaxID=2692166 RepID=A0A845GUK3_9BURK|nr:PAAR domain-containing protein [Duganella vulcania]MYM97022.1 hypothetical protein [Duganella vulcania]